MFELYLIINHQNVICHEKDISKSTQSDSNIRYIPDIVPIGWLHHVIHVHVGSYAPSSR